ncbi:hypothetical protein AB0H58_04405 [Nocardia neocaledoniensis]|uniref:hypothetical protein n=1 Tax=Nocardia neocaledoniensis TaxID=236511 RepID=UPI0033F3AF44
MHRDLLPWPAGFGSQRPRYLIAAAIVATFVPGTVLFLAGFVTAAEDADLPLAVFCGSGAAMCGFGLLGLPVFVRVRRRRLPRLSVLPEPAVFLPAHRFNLIATLGLVLGASVWTGSLLVLTLTIRQPGRELDHLWNYAVLLAGLAVSLVGVFGGSGIARSLRYHLGVRLDPEGLVVESGSLRQATSWDDIAAIVPAEENHRRVVVIHAREVAATGRTWLARRKSALREIRIDATAHRIDPALLYHLIRFYRAEANRRPELGTEAALARIREGDLAV